MTHLKRQVVENREWISRKVEWPVEGHCSLQDQFCPGPDRLEVGGPPGNGVEPRELPRDELEIVRWLTGEGRPAAGRDPPLGEEPEVVRS
jgi:hypothetical protein